MEPAWQHPVKRFLRAESRASDRQLRISLVSAINAQLAGIVIQTKAALQAWHKECRITGGWLWILEKIARTDPVHNYAHAINAGVGNIPTHVHASSVVVASCSDVTRT